MGIVQYMRSSYSFLLRFDYAGCDERAKPELRARTLGNV